MPYQESRERFREYLEVMRLAWTRESFSYTGTFYTCQDLTLLPKPYQQPYPPLYHAATTRETFTNIGTLGLSLLVGVATMTLAEILAVITDYQAAWQAAGHPGQGDVWLRLPIYVAACMNQARSEPQESVVRYYKRVRQAYLHQSTTFENAARASRAAQLMNLTYDDLLHTRVVFGTPEHVTA